MTPASQVSPSSPRSTHATPTPTATTEKETDVALTNEDRRRIRTGAIKALAEEALTVAERRYYDEQTGTWTITPDEAFAAGARWAVSIPGEDQP